LIYEELAMSDDENKADDDEKKGDEKFKQIWRKNKLFALGWY